MLLVDTDILVDALRGAAAAHDWLSICDEEIAVPGFAAMELVEGCRSRAILATVERVLRPLQALWPSRSACGHAARLHRELRL
ncbi:MAG: type II toxin-antitoxin system VapC family toxin [Armatimonadetes bacterium]|nr:type II toxin-antitoxin system VapC family toxin [Armatimonadota bacterium]